MAASPSGANRLRTNSRQTWYIKAEAFYLWQIRVQTPMDPNCKIKTKQLVLHACLFLLILYYHCRFSFITFRSCRHLDRKHTVFGKIVGGLDTLNAIEKVEVDNKDRPIEDIVIQVVQVFVDPFQEADEQLVAERAAEMERLAQEASQSKTKDKRDKNNTQKIYRSGIGKYVKLEQEK